MSRLDPRYQDYVPVRYKEEKFTDVFQDELGSDIKFECRLVYTPDPDSFKHIINECVVTLIDWTSEGVESVKESIREVVVAYLNAGVEWECNVEIE